MINIKRSRTRTTKWNVFFQYSAIGYYVVIGIVLVPLYLQHISQEVYGYWLATGNIIAWLSVVDPGFSMVIQQKISSSYGSRGVAAIGKYVFASIIFTSFFLIFVIGLCFVFSYSFDYFLGPDVPYGNYVSLKRSFDYALIGSVLMILSYSINAINQGLQSSLGVGLIYSIANITGIVSTWYMLTEGFGVVSLGLAILFRAVIYVVGNLAYLLYRIFDEHIVLTADVQVFKEFRSLISYNFLGRIAGILNNQINIYIAATVINAVAVTKLKFTQTIPEMSKLILVKPIVALMPSLTHLLGEGDMAKARDILTFVIRLLIWGTGAAFGGFLLFNDDFIFLWIGPSYYAGSAVNLLVITLLIVTIFTNSFSYLLFAMGNIKMNSVVVFLQALLYVPLVWWGAKNYQLVGIVSAALISELLVSFWYFPCNLFRRLNLSWAEGRKILKEFAIVLTINGFIIWGFNIVLDTNIKGWGEFVIHTIIFMMCYVILLLMSSAAFKVFFKDKLRFLMSYAKP